MADSDLIDICAMLIPGNFFHDLFVFTESMWVDGANWGSNCENKGLNVKVEI